MKLAGIVAAAMLLLSAAGQSGRPAAGAARNSSASNTISIDNFTFNAQTLTVRPGTRVTWVNHDDVPHKIVSTDKKFSSPVLDTDGTFTYTFTTPGTYEYFCSIHPMMKGKVVVVGSR